MTGYGFLLLLRRERAPLVTLAAMVLLARVVLGGLGLAMPGQAEAAEPSVGLVICSGSTGGAQPVKGAPSATFDCPCATCLHAGCALACGPAANIAFVQEPAWIALTPVAADWRLAKAQVRAGFNIRAPPLA